MQTHEIIEQALKLKADERSEIVDRLLQSLDKPDADIDRLWGEEAVRRVRALDDGRMKTYALDEVLRKNRGRADAGPSR